MVGILDSEEELLVAALRRSLVRIAGATSSNASADPPPGDVSAALDGVELVIRELVIGNAERLPALLPGFVFLVTLPIVGQDEAIDLSRRAADVVDAELGGPD